MKTKKTKVKTFVLTAISISAIALATVTGAVNFGLMADAATGSDTSAAEYGETLADQTPDSITEKTWAYTPSSETGWSWVDPTTDYFGSAGSQTFIVKKGSGSTTAYNAVTITVKPRSVSPIIRFGNTGSAAPTSWAGNGSKAKTTDSVYKMTITGSPNSLTMGTVTGGGSYWKGQSVTLTATPNAGYKLKQWSTGSTNSSITVTPYTDTTYTATFETSNTMTVTSSLPTKSGDVSIMTLAEAWSALGGTGSSGYGYDPNRGYNTSTYYMYAINDAAGSNDAASVSTKDNLQAVGLSWYQQSQKPATADNHWTVGNHKVFGGPLHGVYYHGSGSYRFYWYYSGSGYGGSSHGSYWNSDVSGSVYVAVVHK